LIQVNAIPTQQTAISDDVSLSNSSLASNADELTQALQHLLSDAGELVAETTPTGCHEIPAIQSPLAKPEKDTSSKLSLSATSQFLALAKGAGDKDLYAAGEILDAGPIVFSKVARRELHSGTHSPGQDLLLIPMGQGSGSDTGHEMRERIDVDAEHPSTNL
jgi:hypothetical protein